MSGIENTQVAPGSTGDSVQPAVHPVRRKPWIFVAIALSMVVIMLVGAGIWWRNYTTSPGYSLGQLAKSVENKDWDGVQKYVDIEAVVGQVIDVAVSKAVEEDDSGFGAFAAGFAQSMKPGLVQQAKDELRKSIEDGSVSSKGDESLRSYFSAEKVKSVTRIGDEALVTVEVPDGDKTLDLKLKMKRVDDFWRIIAIENIEDLLLTQGN